MLEIRNINIIYNHKIIIDANFKCNDTGITIIKGESGSGKTSLIRNILYQENYFDEYIYNYQKITSSKQLINVFSLMSQNNAFIADLTVKEHFKLMQKLYGTADISDYLQRLELLNTLNKYPNQLSGGEKNRISFLLCILKNSPIIILDEPTAALDSYFTEEVKNIIIELSSNHLFIISSHNESLLELGDVIYEINKQQLCLIKDNWINNKTVEKTEQQKIIMPGIFIKMKKHRLIQNLMMIIILSFSIVLTSLVSSYSFTSTNNHYEEFENLVDNEAIVYKPVFANKKNIFYGGGNEPYINETEKKIISDIKHIDKMTPHLEYDFGYTHTEFEKSNDNSTEYILYKNGKEISQGDFYDRVTDITIVNYDQIDKNQVEKSYGDGGIYFSHELGKYLELKDGSYEISFNLPVPSYVVIGDGEMQIPDDPVYYPINYDFVNYINIKYKISGILKGNTGCRWSKNSYHAIYVPDDLYQQLINENMPTTSKTYYYDRSISNIGDYTTELVEGHEITNIAKAIPWVSGAYKIRIDSVENYETVIKELEKIGFATISDKANFRSIDTMAYQTSDSFIKFSLALTIILTIINLILKYINLYQEKSFKRYFKELGYVPMKITILTLQKYLIDMMIILMTSIIMCFIFQFVCIKINYVIAPISSTTILFIFILSLLIEFIFPLGLGGISYDKVRKH